MKMKLGIFKIIASLIVVSLLAFLVYDKFGGELFSKSTETSISGLLTEIKQISELNTVEMYFNEIVEFNESIQVGGLDLPFTEKKFIFTVKARVKSGIDLSTLNEDSFEVVDNKITLRIQGAKITSKETYDFTAYSENGGLFNPIENEDTLSVLNEFNDKLEQQALQSGIIEKAEENAVIFLEMFLSLQGYDEITIEFID